MGQTGERENRFLKSTAGFLEMIWRQKTAESWEIAMDLKIDQDQEKGYEMKCSEEVERVVMECDGN